MINSNFKRYKNSVSQTNLGPVRNHVKKVDTNIKAETTHTTNENEGRDISNTRANYTGKSNYNINNDNTSNRPFSAGLIRKEKHHSRKSRPISAHVRSNHSNQLVEKSIGKNK